MDDERDDTDYVDNDDDGNNDVMVVVVVAMAVMVIIFLNGRLAKKRPQVRLSSCTPRNVDFCFYLVEG